MTAPFNADNGWFRDGHRLSASRVNRHASGCVRSGLFAFACVTSLAPLVVPTIALAPNMVLAPNHAAAEEFPEPFNTEPESDAQQVTPTEAAQRWQLPAGMEATVFAAEPDVQNPIDLAWDAQGRLWVAENYTYAERDQRFQLDLRDRVLVFEDTDGDGKHDRRTVFTDGVQMLTSVEVGYGGVWLMCPPRLLYIPDRDHDAVPDGPAEVVLDGFEVAQQNYHNFANGLRFGPDGWLYGRCGGSCPGQVGAPGTPEEQRVALEGGIWRYHPEVDRFEVLTSGTTNPWGHDWNDVGELFFTNTVNGHFWHAIPGAHFTRPFTLDPNAHTYELIDFHADHWHFDTGKSWTDSRDGAANDYGGGHAHCGLMIYEGDNWPEQYRGRALTINLHGRRVNQEILRRRGSGYVASHAPDILLAADPWFRGMDLSYGPDGGVYVLDWSDTGECHEHTGVHRTSGRIYKITHALETAKAETNSHPRGVNGFDLQGAEGLGEIDDLHQADGQALVRLQGHENAWYVHQARLVLAEREAAGSLDGDAATAAAARFHSAQQPSEAVAALLTLDATGEASRDFLVEQLRHREEHVRCWAIRLLTESWPLDDCYGPTYQEPALAGRVAHQAEELLPVLVRQAATDSSSVVRLNLASTLQRLPPEHRSELAAALVTREGDGDDHNLPLMIWYGLMAAADSKPDDLVAVAKSCQLPTTRRLIARRLGEEIERHPEPLDELLQAVAARADRPWRLDILNGLAEAMQGWRSAPRPAAWNAVVAALGDEQWAEEVVRELSVVFGDGRSLKEVKQIVADDSESPATRLAALAALIQSDPPELREICEPLLRDARFNVVAAQGLASIDDPEVGRLLVARYRNFRAPQRPKVVSILASRASFAMVLLKAMRSGDIPRDALSAFQVRQIHNLGDEELSAAVAEVWGGVRETSEEKQRVIETLRDTLTPEQLAAADRGAGRALFVKNCQNCHRLYGEGGQIGPDLTGGNRDDLDYLLSNIVDPSAVVDKDYRMTLVATDDGRVLSGLVTARTDRTLKLHTATESLTIDRREVADEKLTEKSPMPAGLLDNLTPNEIRDLISYLAHPSQVSLPADVVSTIDDEDESRNTP